MRKIVNNAIIMEGVILKTSKENDDSIPNVDPNEISLDNLLQSHLLILWRQTYMLMKDSTKALDKYKMHDMRENLKLIMELKKAEKDLLDSMPDEKLEELLKKE